MIAQLFCLIGQIVGVDPDAVPPHDSRGEGKKVPLGGGRVQDRPGVYAHFIEYDGQLVHKCDVYVPLRVLDNLGRFCYLDGLGPEHAGLHDQFVNLGDGVQGLLVHTGDHLDDRLQPVHLIPRIYPFRRIPDLEIAAALEARLAFQNGHAQVLSHARINGGFIYDDGTRHQVAAQDGAGPQYRG